MVMHWICLVGVHLFVSGAFASEPLLKTGEKKISFRAPQLTEEESESFFVPSDFNCDVCKVIAYQFFTHFDVFNQRHKKNKFNIPESDLLDLTEKACHRDIYNKYGVKDIGGKKRLSGEGLETKDAPGVLAGGGMWPVRLANMCLTLAGELGEEEIYNAYKEQPDDLLHFQDYLCFQTGLRGGCRTEKVEL